MLLQSLAEQSDANLVFDGITSDGDGIMLSGRAIRSDAVTQMIQRLEPEAAEIGWGVRPPSIKGTNRTVAGGPWTFTVQLIDQQPRTIPDSDNETMTTSLATSSNTDQQGDR